MIARITLAAALALALAGAASAQQPSPNAATLELVDPHVLRVCADPNDLPFSDQAGAGFENKIAALFGEKLGRPVEYTYFPQVIGFIRNTLNAFRCDVVMGIVQGDSIVQTTTPYYRASYALVFKPGHGLDGVASLADPRLRDMRIGVVARTPPATVMMMNGLMPRAKPYPLTVDTRAESPARNMIGDILSGDVDAGVLWGPLAGYYAKQAAKTSGAVLTVVPLLDERGAPMVFRIAMGVRHSDQTWKLTLDRLIRQNQDEINGILTDYGVPLVDERHARPAPQ
jgi:quinoprotein dehydrogenase-associated probable ABC transporter substrate-binding protein